MCAGTKWTESCTESSRHLKNTSGSTARRPKSPRNTLNPLNSLSPKQREATGKQRGSNRDHRKGREGKGKRKGIGTEDPASLRLRSRLLLGLPKHGPRTAKPTQRGTAQSPRATPR